VRKRAEAGDPGAQLALGAAYASEQGKRKNDTEAVNWLTRSANGGNATAAAALGALYWDGRGVTQGYVNAYTWSAIAAAEGDEVSSYRLTILQSRMSPGEVNEAKHRAAVWLRTHRK
jgi:TPR repeat protein